MKKVFLHGKLGKKFGEVWSLDVDSPSQAVSALFCNNPDIEKYLFKKHSQGVYYGIKKAGEEDFTTDKESLLYTEKDLHVFPLPQGRGFAGSLVMTAAITAASMYVSKKMAEAMERDDNALQTQTKSYLYNGTKNRFQQGATIPVGYGVMKVGGNVVSSCVLNYDYNSQKSKLFDFSHGSYSLVPSYSEFYREDLGPLVSSFAMNVFEGSSKYSFTDPGFQYLQEQLQLATFGAIDGMYGGFEPVEAQRYRFVEKKGNDIGGFMYYTMNYAKGVDKAYLDNFGTNGNWWPDSRIEDETRYRINEINAMRSSFVCLQSEPQLETNQEPKGFYPLVFSEESLDYLNTEGEYSQQNQGTTIYPVQVGERWRGGKKENGVGWFRLESTSIFKSIELLSEGPIDGFADKNRKKTDFKKDTQTPSSSTPLRYEDDDYLQAVYLNDTPVKEINTEVGVDTYNINEFDIDIGLDEHNEMGGENQKILEPQYNFTAYTKEVGGTLYGPRLIDQEELASQLAVNAEAFNPDNTYDAGDIVAENGQTYRAAQNFGYPYDGSENYKEGAVVTYAGSFKLATALYSEYESFDASKASDYLAGDKVYAYDSAGDYKYGTIGEPLDKLKGVYDQSNDYRNDPDFIVGNIYASNNSKTAVLYKITDPSAYAQLWTDYQADSALPDEDPNKKGLTDPSLGVSIDRSDFAEKLKANGQEINPIGIIANEFPLTTMDDDTPNNPDFWTDISIDSVTDTLSLGTFLQLTDVQAAGLQNKKLEEENYLSHTIINPLVEQAYVTLQVDQLHYIYPGDEVVVEYKLGELWEWITGGLCLYYVYAEGKSVASAAYHAVAAALGFDPGAKATSGKSADDEGDDILEAAANIAVWCGLTIYILAEDRFKVGTKIENSGELWPNKAKFRIKYGNEGEIPYVTDVILYGVASSAYRKDIRIFLPPNPNQRDRVIKVYKLSRERNPVTEGEQAARYKENCTLSSVTEILPAHLNYPNSVVIGTRVNAKDVASIPDINYHLRLKKVLIPSNYDPDTRIYTGNWDGTFSPELKWTDNPAWCLYDIISNKRFGIGKFGIKEEHIDRWTLYRMAKYCDELVLSGYSPKYEKIKFSQIQALGSNDFYNQFNHPGKNLAIFHEDGSYESIRIKEVDLNSRTIELEYQAKETDFDCAVEIDYPILEPRYTLNAYIMNSENAFNLINEFAMIFRSFAYWSNGSINFFQDEKKDAVMLFSNSNVDKKGFSYSSTPRTSRTNSCDIRYTDRYNMYRAKVEHSEDREAVQENNFIKQSIDGFGITSQAQAKRATEFLVKSANLETELVSFSTALAGSYLKPGDVIDILDNKRTVGRFAGKIVDVDLHPRGMVAELTLDYPVYTTIDPSDKETWKKITLYAPTGNETIESLDQETNVTDQKIRNMRASQIGEYMIYDISEDNTKIKLYNNLYSFVSGDFEWSQALEDAKTKTGQLAIIENKESQFFVEAILPKDQVAWLGGYHRELPPPEQTMWHNASCSDAIEYHNWADGYPKFSRALETDEEVEPKNIIQEAGFNIAADGVSGVGNFLAISGSMNENEHGGWVHMSGNKNNGYILEDIYNDGLDSIKDSDGTTFAIEDGVNLAKPRQYKIMNVIEKSNGIFDIQALEYNVDKFDNIEKNISINKRSYPVIFNEYSSYNREI